MTTNTRHSVCQKAFRESPLRRLATAAFSIVLAAVARAGDGTMIYLNGTGDWNSTSGWRKNEIAQGGGVATLLRSGALNQNVSGLTLRGIHFNASINNFYGYPITLTNSPFLNATVSGTRLNLPFSGTGVLRKYGVGQIELANRAFQGFSSVSVDEGTLLVSSNQAEMVTGGTLLLNGGSLVFAPTLTSGQAGRAYGATNAAAFFTYGAGTSWVQPNKGNGDSATLVLGGTGEGFVRTNRGALVIAPAAGIAALGVTEKLLVNGNAPLVANGMVEPSMVACDLSGVNAPFHFLTYDAANGFMPATYTDGMGGGSDSIANVTTNTTVAENAHVHALRVNDPQALAIGADKTLTVGDGTQPAGIILNAQGDNATGPTITGGTIDFGTSEGVIWGAGASANYQQTMISSTVAGQNGVTFAARNGKELAWVNIAGVNTYAGGTRIMGGRVSMLNAQAFSAGDIYVFGNHDKGGQLMLAGLTVSNKLHLAGFGIGGSHGTAALYTGGGNPIFENTVSLMDDAGILTSAGTFSMTMNKAVEGEGSLYFTAIEATGTLYLNATNTYAGKTIIQSGILSLGLAGTFGQGDVTNNSTVYFNNASTLLVTNNIGGSGTFAQKGSGNLIFMGDAVTLGSFDIGSSSVAVKGSNTCFQTLAGCGEISAAAGPVNPKALEIGSCTADSVFNGVFTDGASVLGLTKIGSGMLTLTRAQSYSGPTVIREGTLKLQAGLTRPPETGLSYWLDATDTAKVLTDASQTVTNWTDSSAAAVWFRKTADRPLPTYVQNAINGKPAVYFAGNTNRIASTVSRSQKSLFIVNRPTGYETMDGIWGQDNADFGIRTGSSTSWQNNPSIDYAFFNGLPTFIINGQESNDFVQDEPHILYAQRSAGKTCAVALGNYTYDKPQKRSYTGYIGEVIAYDRIPSLGERQQIEDYLAEKWQGNRLHDLVSGENLLPSTTALSIENRAVLDLNGISQTLASLSGEGVITNSSATAVILTVTGESSFKGVISGNIKLVKTGSSTVDFTVRVTATNDVVLDGGTVYLAPYRMIPLQTGLSYWMDALATNTVMVDANNHVTNWISAAGNGVAFKQPSNRIYAEPDYISNAIHGKNAIRFYGTNWMSTAASCKVQTLFIVTSAREYRSLGGLWGVSLGTDSGLRLSGTVSPMSWFDGSLGDIFLDGVYRANGVETKSVPLATPFVFCGQISTPKTSTQNVLGGYVTFATRCYFGDIGEVLAYDHLLSEEEVRNVEAYLSAKWLTDGGLDTSDAIFSQTGQLILTNNVTVDLGGSSQSIHNLSGGGSIQNGNVTLDGTLTLQVSSDGTCDQIIVDGTLALNQTILNVQGIEFLDKAQSHTILTTTGVLTGTFSATNLPKAWTVKVTETGAMLIPYRGTVLFLK